MGRLQSSGCSGPLRAPPGHAGRLNARRWSAHAIAVFVAPRHASRVFRTAAVRAYPLGVKRSSATAALRRRLWRSTADAPVVCVITPAISIRGCASANRLSQSTAHRSFHATTKLVDDASAACDGPGSARLSKRRAARRSRTNEGHWECDQARQHVENHRNQRDQLNRNRLRHGIGICGSTPPGNQRDTAPRRAALNP